MGSDQNLNVNKDLLDRLDQLNTTFSIIQNCLGFLVFQMSDKKDEKSATPKIEFLNNLGFDRNSIAAILGTTPETVSTRLSELKSSKKTKQ